MTKKATWIWYFGDFEIYHHLKLSMQRSDYGHFIPAFWKVSDCNRCVRFKKIVNIASSERVFCSVISKTKLSMNSPYFVPIIE